MFQLILTLVTGYLFIAFGASVISLARGGHRSGADKAVLFTLLGAIVGAVPVYLYANTLSEGRGLGIVIVHVFASMVMLVAAPVLALVFQGTQRERPSRRWWIGGLAVVAAADIGVAVMGPY